ncbi:hypothetical protein YC2023_036938 [Brassica napus]
MVAVRVIPPPATGGKYWACTTGGVSFLSARSIGWFSCELKVAVGGWGTLGDHLRRIISTSISSPSFMTLRASKNGEAALLRRTAGRQTGKRCWRRKDAARISGDRGRLLLPTYVLLCSKFGLDPVRSVYKDIVFNLKSTCFSLREDDQILRTDTYRATHTNKRIGRSTQSPMQFCKWKKQQGYVSSWFITSVHRKNQRRKKVPRYPRLGTHTTYIRSLLE